VVALLTNTKEKVEKAVQIWTISSRPPGTSTHSSKSPGPK